MHRYGTVGGMTKIQSILSKEVRWGLCQQRMSQKALAELVGVSQKHLSLMLSGRAEGTLSMWQQLIDAVGSEQFGTPEPRDVSAALTA
jgi:predicted XRE-type DNA-binding protein